MDLGITQGGSYYIYQQCVVVDNNERFLPYCRVIILTFIWSPELNICVYQLAHITLPNNNFLDRL